MSSPSSSSSSSPPFPSPLPLWVTAVVSYPGVLLPLNVFGSAPLRMIRNVLEFPHLQRYFFMALPAATTPPADPPNDLPLVGTLVLVEKLFYNREDRVSILVRGIRRGIITARFLQPGESGPIEMAAFEPLDDEENLEDLEKISIQSEKILRVIEKLNQRYESNSLWRDITQKAGPVPLNNPELLSFWALSTLPPSVRLEVRARLIRSQSTLERLRFIASSTLFKNVASFSPNREESQAQMASEDNLSARCIESICENLTPDNRKRMKYLPVELMDRVVAQLKHIDRLNLENLISLKHCTVETLNLSSLSKLSDEWLKVISKYYLNVTHLDLSFGYAITDANVAQCLHNLKNLQVIVLDGCKLITDEGLAPLTECTNLTRVRLNGTKITPNTIKKIKALPQVSHLAVSGTRFPDLGIYILVGMSSAEIKEFQAAEKELQKAQEEAERQELQQLLQEQAPADDVDMALTPAPAPAAPNAPPPPPVALPPLPPGPPPALDKVYPKIARDTQELAHTDPISLNSLHMAETKITSSGCKKLPLMRDLTELDISFNQRITEWAFLSQMTQLTYLDMSMNAAFESHQARFLTGLVSLKFLSIAKTELADDGLSHLFKLPNLECIRLGGTNITDYLGTGVHNWPKLRTLHLQYTSVTAAVVESLKSLPLLTALKLTGCHQFLDNGFQALTDQAFEHLEHLDIGTRNITDASLGNIGVLTGLRTLNLWNTKVTTNGADLVKTLTSLTLDESMNTTWGTFLFLRG